MWKSHHLWILFLGKPWGFHILIYPRATPQLDETWTPRFSFKSQPSAESHALEDQSSSPRSSRKGDRVWWRRGTARSPARKPHGVTTCHDMSRHVTTFRKQEMLPWFVLKMDEKTWDCHEIVGFNGRLMAVYLILSGISYRNLTDKP
jgi:hypothetical protein